MTLDGALRVLDAWRDAGVPVVLDGGWAVDAAVGSERQHADLDVAIPRASAETAAAVLRALGFAAAGGHAPENPVFERGGQRVDVHLYTLDAAGDVTWGIAYPRGSLAGRGRLAGREVACVDPAWMYRFKTSYPPRACDLDDLRRLVAHLGIVPLRPEPWLDRAAWRAGAAPGCPACGGSGWRRDEGWAPCGCTPACAACGGAGYVAGGLESCACRIAAERVALANAAGLPWVPAPGELPAEAAAWFARYRPEDDAPWLTIAGAEDGAVAAALSRLCTGAGVPVATTSDPRQWRRIVAVLDGERVTARALVDACAGSGKTLVFACSRAPFADGGGVEQTIGERAAATLWERGAVLTARP